MSVSDLWLNSGNERDKPFWNERLATAKRKDGLDQAGLLLH